MKIRLLWMAALAVVCLLVPGKSIHAQSTESSNAKLTGVLTDPSGAVVGGAIVRAIPAGGAAIAAASGADGRFVLTLSPGRYRVVVAASSFTRVEQELTLAAGETREWNVRLVLERLSANVVVSATAEPTPATAATFPVDTITREDITERQAIWLAPLIASESGAALSKLGPGGGVASFFLDGGDSDFTKFLVDGVPMNQPGGAMQLENYDLEGVDKIEIVHGASSALFGSDAVSGVVQILSHRGTTTTPELVLEGDGGTFESGRGSAQLSGLAGKFDYSATAGYFATSGQGPNDYMRDLGLAGNVGYRFSDTNWLRLTVRDSTFDAGVPGQELLLPPSLVDHDNLHTFTTGLTWDFQPSEHWHNHLIGWDTRIDQGFFNSFGNAFNLFNRAGFDEQSSYLFPRGGVTVGYTYEVENGSEGGPHSRRNNQAGYIEARYQFGPRVTVTAGARAEANASFGTRVVPRAGVAYALRFGHDFWGATRLRASYGEGIKEPDFFDSFSQDPCDPGNPNLSPERSKTFDAGADQVLGSDRLRVSVDFFHNDYYDIVSFASFPPTGACPFGTGTFFNTDTARAYGARSSFEAKPVRWLRFTGNYTYDDSLVIASPNFFDLTLAPGNRLAKRPMHAATLIANAHYRRMNWNLVGYYVGRRTDSDFLGFGITSNPSYVRWDLGASYEFTRKLSATARVENLFDRRYQEAIGYPALGLNYRLGMRFVWGGK
ncbi:MAG: TonB-dependent receptor [Candidatus Acidiferrales bacterium]